jgi:hypothetical protein
VVGAGQVEAAIPASPSKLGSPPWTKTAGPAAHAAELSMLDLVEAGLAIRHLADLPPQTADTSG